MSEHNEAKFVGFTQGHIFELNLPDSPFNGLKINLTIRADSADEYFSMWHQAIIAAPEYNFRPTEQLISSSVQATEPEKPRKVLDEYFAEEPAKIKGLDAIQAALEVHQLGTDGNVKTKGQKAIAIIGVKCLETSEGKRGMAFVPHKELHPELDEIVQWYNPEHEWSNPFTLNKWGDLAPDIQAMTKGDKVVFGSNAGGKFIQSDYGVITFKINGDYKNFGRLLQVPNQWLVVKGQ